MMKYLMKRNVINMKYAVKIVETLTKVEIVEAEDWLEAQDKVSDAYYNGDIILYADNSSVDMELENDSEFYEKEMDLQTMETTL